MKNKINYLIEKFQNSGKSKNPRLIRVRNNDSPTQIESEEIEDGIAKRHAQFVQKSDSLGYPSDDYYIPYVGEIKIPGVGRTSISILDSLTVNAQRAGLSLADAIGLASLETKLGAVPNLSIQGYIEGFKRKHGRSPSSEEISKYERAMMNSSFARNYGGIYPQFLINDHEWFQRGWDPSRWGNKLKDIKSPLEHGFSLYKLGLYNTGDPKHSEKVHQEGQRIMNTQEFKDYQKQSKFHK